MARLGRPWKEFKQELLQRDDFRHAYEELEPEFQIARAIIALRAAKHVTQEEMARKAEIKRPMLSRFESAKVIPTIPTLSRLAAALNAKLEFRFVDKRNKGIQNVPRVRLARAMRERHA